MNKEIDITVILRSHSAQLRNILEQLKPIALHLNNGLLPNDNKPTLEDLENTLQNPVKELHVALQWLLREEARVVNSFKNGYDFQSLIETAIFLKDYLESDIGKCIRAPFLFEHMDSIIEFCAMLHPDASDNNEAIVSLAQRIKTIICTYNLMVALFMVHEMRQQINSLHDFFTYNTKIKTPFVVTTLYDLVHSAIQENAQLALSRNIGVRISGILNMKVRVRKPDMIRAISQLLHNAIIYNYAIDNNSVQVSIHCNRARHGLCIEIQNWGYPITSDEIKTRSIFQAGKRGTFAARSREPGNGIGLAEAIRIIESHRGSLCIQSVPKQQSTCANNYHQPFLTTVSVELQEYAGSE